MIIEKGSYKEMDISKKLADNIRTIKKFGAKRIGLFGSAVRGELKIESDIDILVEFEEDEKFSNLINLYFYLQDLLSRKIDLVTPESISPYLAPYILKEVKYIEDIS
ncbi:MAG: nucleotidyltransferase family protein [Euryarchaeota archaeon]|nr:nucleotidyltransferase family protein [Euryarchaeota archaeon]